MSSVAKKNVRTNRRGPVSGPVGWIRSSRVARRMLLVAVIGGVCVAAGMGVWRRVRAHVESQPEYMVAADDIEITAPPGWIHTDVKTEVIRDAGLSKKISILDEHTAELLTQAFALNPWVERVNKVSTSYPAHIQVDLSYRRPAAMVEVPDGLLPVDGQGVLLPTADFSEADAHSYPRIAGVTSSPRGLIGTEWGDVEVEQGAKLAAVLQTAWPTLGLHHIQSERAEQSDNPSHAGLQLVTRAGTVLVWGDAPGEERANEISAAEKLARLQKLIADYQTPDSVPLNLRDLRR